MKKGNEKRKTYYVGIDRQFSPKPRYITPTESQILHPLKPNAFAHDPLKPLSEGEEEFVPITLKNNVLKEVTVKAKRRYFTNNNYKYKNEAWGKRWATLYYDINRELDNIRDRGEKEPTVFEFLAKKNMMFNNPECIDLPQPANVDGHGEWFGKMAYGHRSIQWIVDNGEKGCRGAFTNDSQARGDLFFPTWLDEIKCIYIVPHDQQDGGVKIYIYRHHVFTTESQKGLRRTYFQGFNTPSTFKMEDYNVIPPMADFRRTIYWNPDIKTDKEGKAKVEFFNNSTCEEMYISTEGMTNDGRILVNE